MQPLAYSRREKRNIDSSKFAVLQCHGKLFPIPLAQLSEFELLQRMAFGEEGEVDEMLCQGFTDTDEDADGESLYDTSDASGLSPASITSSPRNEKGAAVMSCYPEPVNANDPGGSSASASLVRSLVATRLNGVHTARPLAVAGGPARPKLLAFPLPRDMTLSALRAIVVYTRLPNRTPVELIGRHVTDFIRSISLEEERFVLRVLSSTPILMETMVLTHFLQHRTLLVLLSGALAIRLTGRPTADMRTILGMDPNARQEELFDAETLNQMEIEKAWKEKQ